MGSSTSLGPGKSGPALALLPQPFPPSQGPAPARIEQIPGTQVPNAQNLLLVPRTLFLGPFLKVTCWPCHVDL